MLKNGNKIVKITDECDANSAHDRNESHPEGNTRQCEWNLTVHTPIILRNDFHPHQDQG